MASLRLFLLELEHLHDVYGSKGEEVLQHLLNDNIAVNIKVDQSALVVKRDGNDLQFFSREGRQQITTIKRASMDLYEDSIAHIQSRPWQKLPNALEIYMENFTDQLPSIIRYSSKPKNNLIISYVKQNGKIIRPDNPINQEVAQILDISPPPVLFSGKLTPEQSKQIIDFVKASPETRAIKYGKTRFIEFVTSLFVHPQELEWLKRDGYEGLVFYFGNENPVSAKIVDPLFTVEIKQKKQDSLTLFSKKMQTFLYDNLPTDLKNATEQFTPDTKDPEKLFINFASFLTKYIVEKHAKYLDAHFHPHYKETQQKRFANLSYHLMPTYMQELVQDHWWTHDVFVFIINSLRQEQKRINANTGLTADRKEMINQLVQQLRQRKILHA